MGRRKEHSHTWEEERHFQQEEKRDELGHKKLRGFCLAAAQKSRRTVQGRTVRTVRTGVHIYCCYESAVPCCTEIEEAAVQIAEVFQHRNQGIFYGIFSKTICKLRGAVQQYLAGILFLFLKAHFPMYFSDSSSLTSLLKMIFSHK